MRLGFLLSIVLALHNAVGATVDKGRRSAPNGTSATILTPDLVEIVQEMVNANEIQGLTMAIVHKTGPAELGAWGIKSENGTKMTTDTLFNIASCSKAFLSASLGILIDDFTHGHNTTPLPTGLSSLTWRTKVEDILPNDWNLMDPWASQKANLIDILSHVSGLSRNDYSYRPNDSVSDVTRNLRNLRPTFELREQWQYNNQMFMVGAYIVSTLSGMHFVDFVNYRIFKPLGMHSSTYSTDAAIRTGKFTSTWTSFGRLIPPWIEEESVDLMAGPAGVISSVEELALWTRMLLNGGIDPNTNTTIIPSAEFDVITSAHSIVSPDGGATTRTSTAVYGLGWFRLSILGHDVILHNGDAPGVTSAVVAAPEDGIGIVVLVNADAKDRPIFDIILKVAEKAFGSANTSSSPPANQPTISRRSTLSRRTDMTARAESAGTSSLDLAGTYYNPGYGALVLCTMHSTSPSCESVLDDFRAVNNSLSPNSTNLFAYWRTMWATHVQFTHTNAGQYLVSIGTIYPDGFGRNSTPFSTLVPVTIGQFVVENERVVGFGFNETGDSDVTHNGQSVEETSQIWFVKEA